MPPWKSYHHILTCWFVNHHFWSKGLPSSKRNRRFLNGGWKKQHGWLKEELGNLENLEISDQTSMSRTFCRMDAWSNDERMAGPKWNSAQLIGKSQKGRYEHEKDLNHLPTKSNLTLLKCHVVSFTENFYTLTPRCPGPISIHSKKRYGVTSPTYLAEKKNIDPNLFMAWPSQPTSPQNLFPLPVGWWKKLPVTYNQRLVPLKDGTLFARKEKEWQCQSHDHRGICDVIGVLKFQRDLMGDLIDSLAGPKYVHVNVFVCVCVCA